MTFLAPRRIAALFLLAVILLTGVAEIGAYFGGWIVCHASLDQRIRRHYAREAKAHGCHASRSAPSACRMACCGDSCTSGAACRCGSGDAAPAGLLFRAPGCHGTSDQRTAPPPASLDFRFLADDPPAAVLSAWSAPARICEEAPSRIIDRRSSPPDPPPEHASAAIATA